jgi:hypothetical protein
MLACTPAALDGVCMGGRLQRPGGGPPPARGMSPAWDLATLQKEACLVTCAGRLNPRTMRRPPQGARSGAERRCRAAHAPGFCWDFAAGRGRSGQGPQRERRGAWDSCYWRVPTHAHGDSTRRLEGTQAPQMRPPMPAASCERHACTRSTLSTPRSAGASDPGLRRAPGRAREPEDRR